jgi:hypothetical protein
MFFYVFLFLITGEIKMMFQRLARNFVKYGYFPTDSETLARILNALAPAEAAEKVGKADEGNMAIFDPTAGEGIALAECKQHLSPERTLAYGVEIDEERAWHAKTLLDHCIHGDLMDCLIERRSFGLVFFNPPYGDLSADQSGGHFTMEGRPRLEKLYYRRTIGTLQLGGVMVAILPYSSLDAAFAEWLSCHLTDVKVFLAPTQQYKQIVLFGIRREVQDSPSQNRLCAQLTRIGQGELPEELPSQWLDKPYTVPVSKNTAIRFGIHKLDAKQLTEVVRSAPCLWTQFGQRFNQKLGENRRPLMDLSQWHLALALAAGQVSGVVRSQDGRTYLIRGSTHKMQSERIDYSVDAEGKGVETCTRLDRFVPVIRALDMTPNSPTYGRVLIVQ